MTPAAALIFSGPPKNKIRQNGQVSPAENIKRIYATPQQPGNPANGGPDTYGMPLVSLILLFRLSLVGTGRHFAGIGLGRSVTAKQADLESRRKLGI